MAEKMTTCLDAGIPPTWSVDSIFRTVIVYHLGRNPARFASGEDLDGGLHMPGFRPAVADDFGR